MSQFTKTDDRATVAGRLGGRKRAASLKGATIDKIMAEHRGSNRDGVSAGYDAGYSAGKNAKYREPLRTTRTT